MYRLYIDEVGTDDLGDVNSDNGRYLSLSGIAMLVNDARDNLSPCFAGIKADIFNHDPDDPLIFHRKKIVKYAGPFSSLKDDQRRAEFDARILSAMTDCPYSVITALIDKKAMLAKHAWTNKEPYHYLMEVMVEKYAQFLERKNSIGDIMPEGRMGKKDERLQRLIERDTHMLEHGADLDGELLFAIATAPQANADALGRTGGKDGQQCADESRLSIVGCCWLTVSPCRRCLVPPT